MCQPNPSMWVRVGLSQGAVLSTSDRGGVRIQYSKNPFGKKRDASGNWISTHEPQPYQQQPAYVYGGAPYSPGGPAGMAVSPSPAAAAPDSGGAYSGVHQPQQQYAPAPAVDAAGAPGSVDASMQQAGHAPEAQQPQQEYALQPKQEAGEQQAPQQGFGALPAAQPGGEAVDAMTNGGLPGLAAADEPGEARQLARF